jgi:hypothetical protein
MFELYVKYLLEGIAVAVAAYFIPRKKVEMAEIIFIALSAAATFAVLDIFAPKVGEGARKGAGFGIGANTVGWPMERFEDKKATDMKDYKSEDSSKTSEDSSKASNDSSKMSHGSDATAKKEGFYAEEKSEDSSKDSSKASEGFKDEQIMGFENNKAYSMF